jgi:hypothetical protein
MEGGLAAETACTEQTGGLRQEGDSRHFHFFYSFMRITALKRNESHYFYQK